MAEIIKLRITWGIILTVVAAAGGWGALGFQVKMHAKTIEGLVIKMEKIQSSCNRVDYRINNIESGLERLENASRYRVNPGP